MECYAAPVREGTTAENASPDMQQRARIYLPFHIHVGVTPDGAVFLDERRNRYSAIGLAETQIAARVVHNWPRSDLPVTVLAQHDPDSEQEDRVTHELLSAGLLTLDEPRSGPIADRKEHVNPKAALVSIGEELEAQLRNTRRSLRVFTQSIATVIALKRFKSFEYIVMRQRVRIASRAREFSLEELIAVVSQFRRLRAYTFTAENRCLFHTMVLVEFLALHRMFPCWVFGARTHPWGAHTWVQHNEYLLDTDPTKIGEFTPILVI